MTELREKSEEEAIRVFARNLKDLLLAAPAGSRATMGLDPGIRTGVKVAVVDATGKALETATIYPFPPRNDVRGAQAELARLIGRHRVELIAIGNGTGSRETERLVADMLSDMPAPRPMKVDRERGRRVDLFGLRARRGRISRPRRLACAARSRSPGGFRTRWPNWSRSNRNRSASGNISMMSINIASAARWRPWSRTP